MYLAQANKEKQEYQEKVNEYQQQVNAHDAATKEALQRFEDLQKDEDYKEAHCRLCPQCGKTVQKLEGCDSMKCGTDYHGGNQQTGCGASFNWGSARPYHRGRDTANLPKPVAEVDLTAAAEVKHHLRMITPSWGNNGAAEEDVSDELTLKCEVKKRNTHSFLL